MAFLAPSLVVFGVLIDLAVFAVWGRVPPEQVPDGLVRAIAVMDALLKLCCYGAAPWILFCERPRSRRSWAWLLAIALVVVMLVLEVAGRWWGAAFGDLRGRIAQALGLGVRGYAFLPVIGATVGLIACLIWRCRHAR